MSSYGGELIASHISLIILWVQLCITALICVIYHIFSVDHVCILIFYLCLLVPKLYEQMHLFMILLVIHINYI
jgi:hypothetical protein